MDTTILKLIFTTFENKKAISVILFWFHDLEQLGRDGASKTQVRAIAPLAPSQGSLYGLYTFTFLCLLIILILLMICA